MLHRVASDFLTAILLIASGQLYACNSDTGERKQQIGASWAGEGLVAIQYDGDVRTYFELPSGKKLGVAFKEARNEVYVEQGKWRAFNVELIQVEYFDATAMPIKRIKEGLSGANSSSTLDEKYLPGVGSSKLRIEFNKPVCVPTGATHSVGPSGES